MDSGADVNPGIRLTINSENGPVWSIYFDTISNMRYVKAC
jgi:hypothetical protein